MKRITKDQPLQVSPDRGNAPVVGSLFSQREIKFRAWLIEDEGFTDEGPKMTYDLAFEEYAPVNEQLKSVLNLMQFTGLKDKNGKEIYEGDILRTETDKPMVVGWSNKFASFVLERDGWAFQHWFGEAADPEYCEIIGNIFENPELLQTLR